MGIRLNIVMLKGTKMKFKEILNSQTVHNVAMTLFTFCLVLFSFLTWHTIDKQTSISEELKNMHAYQNEQKIRLENQKLLEERKELKIIIENIRSLFSPSGLKERELHSKEENIELANVFYQYLIQGLDNYLLANNQECLKQWMKAINAVYLYADKYSNLTLRGLPDDEFKKMFMIHITGAWKSVINVYIKFNLPHASFDNNQKNGEHNNANSADAKNRADD